MDRSMRRLGKNRVAFAVGLLLASWLVQIVGWSLPWEHYIDDHSRYAGWGVELGDGGPTADALLVGGLAFGVVGAAFAIGCLASGMQRPALVLLALPAIGWGAISLLVSVHERNLAADLVPGQVLRVNSGVYVAILGSAMVFSTGLLTLASAFKRGGSPAPAG